MRRMRLDIGYDGTLFHGWARQPQLRTVQGTLEDALAQITGTPVSTIVAGRTDTGVHARRQTVHLDLSEEDCTKLVGRAARTPAQALAARLRGALNAADAHDLVIHNATEVPPEFNARFAAQWRAYCYYLADNHSFIDPLNRRFITEHKGELDVALMDRAAAELVGLHDYLPFCKPRAGATTIRTIERLSVTRNEDAVIEVALRADAFCHHMVRAIVGALIKVGAGAWPATQPAELIARVEASGHTARNTTAEVKTQLGPMFVAPARGLVLTDVGYPDDPADYAQQVTKTQARRAASEV